MKAHTQSDLLEIAERLGNHAKMLEALLQNTYAKMLEAALLQNTCGERLEGFATLSKEDMSWYTLHCAELVFAAFREVDGRKYVVLRNVSGILCVYRVRTDGRLKGLKRWPSALET
jgi:hypothetical protein